MSLLNKNVRVAVSSVLNRDVKQFGKKCMFDGNEDTCWNSEQGKKQWIRLAFDEEITLENSALQLNIQFQGGFSCKVCSVSLLDDDGSTVTTSDCYPEDVNSIQKFDLNFSQEKPLKFSVVQISFNDTTDFFGRITVYYLDVIRTQ